MKAPIIEWPHNELHLYPLSDTHVGSLGLDEKRLRAWADMVAADPYAMAIGVGDQIGGIAYSDKRFDASDIRQPITPEWLQNPFYLQAMAFIDMVQASRGKWGAVVAGNHETSVLYNHHLDVTAIIAERIGAHYIGSTEQSGWLIVRFIESDGKPAYTLRIFIIHGWGGGELRGADALRLQRLLQRKDCDILLMGHVHRGDTFAESVERVSCRGVVSTSKRIGMIVPPMCGKEKYIQRKGANEPVAGHGRIDVIYRHIEHRRWIEIGSQIWTY